MSQSSPSCKGYSFSRRSPDERPRSFLPQFPPSLPLLELVQTRIVSRNLEFREGSPSAGHSQLADPKSKWSPSPTIFRASLRCLSASKELFSALLFF